MWPPKNQQQLRNRTKKQNEKKWKKEWKRIICFARIFLNETPAWDGYSTTNPLVTEHPRAPFPSLQPGMMVGTVVHLVL